MRIGPYALEAELGRGGMGAVYRGRDAQGRRVAVKVLTAAGDLDLAFRFQREVAALRRLDHPAVAAVLDAGVEGGRPWLAMPLVEGPSLAGRLRAGGPLPWREAAQVVARVARGVAHAHGRGVLHRDLKASNVLLGPEGPVLVDFGLVRAVAPDGSLAGLTRTGQVAGTPGYMAPEQALGEGARVGPATDVYGLGALLFEALTGRPPFVGASALATLEAVVQAAPDPPSRHAPPGAELPAALDALCLACLAKDPADRPTSAEAVALALEALTAGRGVAGGRARRRGAGAAGAQVARWRRPALLGAGAAGALALALAVARAWVGPGGSPSSRPAPAPGPGAGPSAVPGEGPAPEPDGGPSPGALEGPGAEAARDAALLAPVVSALAIDDLATARSAAERGLEDHPDHPAFLAGLALVTALDAQRAAASDQPRLFADAEALLARARVGGAGRVVVLNASARVALTRGDLDRAAREVEAALRLAPDHDALRALALEVRERLDHALTAWLDADAAIARRPGLAPPHATRARLLASLGARHAALVALEVLAPDAPEDPGLEYARLQALAHVAPEHALARLERAPAPLREAFQDVRALALARLARADEAVAACPDAHDLAPPVVEALLELGDFPDAADLCARVLGRDARAGPTRAELEALGLRCRLRLAHLEPDSARAATERTRARAAALAAARAGPPGQADLARLALEADALAGEVPLDDLAARLARRRRARLEPPTGLADLELLAFVASQGAAALVADDALSRLLALSLAHPAPPEVWATYHAMRADVRSARDDAQGALADFERFLALQPPRPGEGHLLAKRVTLLVEAGLLGRADEVLAGLPAGSPERASADAALAVARGDLVAARAALGPDVARAPRQALALRVEAELAWEDVIARLRPRLDGPRAGVLERGERVALARAALRAGDPDLAELALAPLDGGGPERVDAQATRAALLGARGDRRAAREALRRLGARVPGSHPDARWALDRLAALPADGPPAPEDPGARAVAAALDALVVGDLERATARIAEAPPGTPGRAGAAARAAVARATIARRAGGAGDLVGARAAVDAAEREAPDDPGVLVAASRLAALAEGSEAGARRLALALERAPKDPGLLILAAQAARSRGDRGAALAHARRALVVAPEDHWAASELLAAATAPEDLAEAAAVAERLVLGAPRTGEAYLTRARARLAASDPTGALADAARARELGSGGLVERTLAATAWWQLGRPDLALPPAREAAALGPSESALPRLLVWLELAAGEVDAGLARAAALEADAAQPAGLRARALELAGRLAEAVERARGLPEGAPYAAGVVARDLLRRDRVAEAEAAAARALTAAPAGAEGRALLHLVRGFARWRRGDGPGAREDLEQARLDALDPAAREAALALALLAREEAARAAGR